MFQVLLKFITKSDDNNIFEFYPFLCMDYTDSTQYISIKCFHLFA